jgi:rhodanese-related sulfurtransferase
MSIKPAKELVEQANREVTVLSADDARAMFDKGEAQFVDVREPAEWQKGRVPGAVHVPRGLLEFAADLSSPTHKPEFETTKRLVLYCAAGGRSALAAKTLKDMGYENVAHMQGGFGAWSQADHPTEDDA